MASISSSGSDLRSSGVQFSLDSPPRGKKTLGPTIGKDFPEAPFLNDVQREEMQKVINQRGEVVCYIQTPDPRKRGTGFLVSPELLVTNNHVIGSAEEAGESIAWIFKIASRNDDGVIMVKLVPIRLAPAAFFFTSPFRLIQNLNGTETILPATPESLDVTVVAIEPKGYPSKIPRATFFSIFGKEPTLALNSPLTVLQCPQELAPQPNPKDPMRSVPTAGELQCAFGRLEEIVHPSIRYQVSTAGGASGGPVVNSLGEAVGVHHQAVTGGLREGVLVTVIRDALASKMAILQPLIDSIHRAPAARGINGFPFLVESFIGREAKLEELVRRLTENRCVAVSGLGGVGKSAFAAKYAYEAIGYDYVFVIPSDSRASIESGLRSIANQLEVPPGEMDYRLKALKSTITGSKDKILVVIDNLNNSTDLDYLDEGIPVKNDVKLLITSNLRKSLEGRYINVMDLGPFDPQDAENYLLGAVDETDKDREQAARLAHDLGYLPLALKQAAAYIRTHQEGEDAYTFRRYADELPGGGLEHLAGLDESERTVFNTWDKSIGVISKLSRGQFAVDVLNLFSVLANAPLPIRDLKALKAIGQHDLQTAVDRLHNYSLLEKAPKGYLMHSLLQKVVKFNNESLTRKHLLWALTLFHEMAKDWDPKDYRVRMKLELYIPHFEAVVMGLKDDIEARDLPALDTLMDILWGYYCHNGKYQRSLELATEHLTLQERHNETAHQKAESHARLGISLCRLGRYNEALKHHLEAIKLKEESLPEQRVALADGYNDLAVTLLNLGQYNEAFEYQKKALAIYRLANHKDKEITRMHNNIGCTESFRTNFVNAIYFHKRALEARLATSSDQQDPYLAMSYDNLGMAMIASIEQGTSRFGESFSTPRNASDFDIPIDEDAWRFAITPAKKNQALDYQQKALDIRKNSLGEKHPLTADSYYNLGHTYHVLEDYNEALNLHKKALAIRKDFLGDSHPDTKRSLQEIESIQIKQAELAAPKRIVKPDRTPPAANPHSPIRIEIHNSPVPSRWNWGSETTHMIINKEWF